MDATKPDVRINSFNLPLLHARQITLIGLYHSSGVVLHRNFDILQLGKGGKLKIEIGPIW